MAPDLEYEGSLKPEHGSIYNMGVRCFLYMPQFKKMKGQVLHFKRKACTTLPVVVLL